MGTSEAQEENSTHIQIAQRQKINIWVMVATVGGLLLNAAIAGGLWANLTKDVTTLQKQVGDIQTDLGATKIQIPALKFTEEQIKTEADENKLSIAAENLRIDKVTDTFGTKLDSLIESLNKVATQVEVLSSKFEDAKGNKP